MLPILVAGVRTPSPRPLLLLSMRSVFKDKDDVNETEDEEDTVEGKIESPKPVVLLELMVPPLAPLEEGNDDEDDNNVEAKVKPEMVGALASAVGTSEDGPG
ncbi:hypothetical protein BGZ83_004997 [Gryganskiella cystojenkinii]|nr:hypothetical protein BGZ83_004997 [Gryganskiella cystojenkinii]